MELDLTDKDDVVTLMKSSNNYAEWDKNADRVRASNGGEYTKFWFKEIILSGLHENLSRPFRMWTSDK